MLFPAREFRVGSPAFDFKVPCVTIEALESQRPNSPPNDDWIFPNNMVSLTHFDKYLYKFRVPKIRFLPPISYRTMTPINSPGNIWFSAPKAP